MKYALTNPQNSIWVTEKFFTNTSINNISGYTLINEQVNFDVLKNAINEVIKTNDAMRLKFKEENDSCFQYLEDYNPFDIDIIELSSEKDIKTKALDLAKVSFDIKNSYLFRFLLFKLPNNQGGYFLTAHHLIGDSWGLGLIVREIANTYSSMINHSYTSTINPSYLNYINSEQEYLSSNKFNADKEYWDKIFSTIPENSTIPSFKTTNYNNNNCNGNRLNFNIPENTINKINAFCKENKISLYNFFMAIYSLYISRVSNLDDFVIGTPILNRTNFEQKHTAGMFISTAPLRININNELSFINYSQEIGINTISLFRHQKYPYQYILENLRKTDSSIPNLYNIILSYQITKTLDNDSGIKCSSEWISNGCCADDLQIHLFDINDENSITVAYDYKTSKYDEDDISALHNRILTIINQIINNNNILLKDIEIVTPEEKHKILYEFNNTYADYPRDKTIVDLFEEQVEKTPDNIAVVFEDQKLTYRELNEKANQLARYLISKNVTNGDIITILFNRSLEMIISILAVLKTGATYLPLDPQYPESRLKYIFKDCQAKYILTNDVNLAKSFNNAILYNKDSILCNNMHISNLNIHIPSSSIAYLIYTSGSTGNPKGVMITHNNVNNFIFGIKNKIDFSTDKTIVSVTTISFDIFVLESLLPLQTGMKIVIANEIEQNDITLFNKLCLKNNVNIIQTTPSRFKILISNKEQIEYLKNITDLIIGGETFPQFLLEELRSLTSCNIYNVYGPTETTVWSTIKLLCSDNIISIGKPLSNTNCYILSNANTLLPSNTPGNLFIGGSGVSNGYWNNPNLTNEKFIINPHTSEGIIYNTGDLAFFTDNGELFHLGRSDFQVKINGHRIELGEIEKVILENKDISNCIVCKYNKDTLHDVLCAYYTSLKTIEPNSIIKYISYKLPNYMIPQYFIQLNSLPFTPNGKLDKKSLPKPYVNINSKLTIKPRNAVDNKLINLLKNLFQIKEISITNSFFELGGDSLSAINFANHLSGNFNQSITVKDIFDYPIIKDLSDHISELANKKINEITVQNKKTFYPVSSAQKRIYYSYSLDNNSILYNIAGGLIIDKELDIIKLENCFKKLINRHESLRTHFDIKNEEIVQIIDDNIDFNLEIINVSTDDINTIYTEFVKPFDLFKAPLFRANIFKLKNGKMLLLLDMHHIISDGTSLNILLNELCTLYNNGTLSDKHITYKDFASWEQEQLETEKLNLSKEYWLNQFKTEIPLLNIPTIYPRPSTQSFEGSNYYAKLSKEQFEKINKLSKDLNVTPYMLMISCYYILLSKYTSQDDIVIGSPIIGRELPELSNLLGMFVNSLPLRNTVNSDLNFNEFVNVVKDNCLSAFKNQSYPFDELVKSLNIKRDTSRNPLFDTMFVFQNNGYPKVNFNGINAEYFIPNNNISKFDLTLEILPIDGEYSLRFEYCTKLFDDDFIKRLSSHYINIIDNILNNSNIKISNIDMLSLEERDQILFDFNNTKVNYPRDKSIIDLFEEQVQKTPDNIAVIFENQKLTYRELNEKANQVARFLLSNDAYSGDIICILLDKSLEMLISILGILKIGATFLPIDITYPNERIDYIIRDSKSNILLTNQSFIHKVNDTIKSLCIDLNNAQIFELQSDNLNIDCDSSDLAYVMYTSGSTGNPKGVMVTHRNVVRLVKNNNFINFDKSEHILQTGSIVFDACTFEIWGALLNGFELYIIKKEDLLDSYLLENYLTKNDITTLWLTAPLFNQLSESNPSIFKNVKKILTGGDVLSPKHINSVMSACPNLTIINGYGPTENTTFSCCFTIDKKYSTSIPIGKPISNSTAYVISKSGSLCPINVPGELWVGGDGVSAGYLNNEILTEEKFISNPFDSGLTYKTGDLVKWLPDGNIQFIGRIDNQVKIRGFRIELSEINKKILDNPSIKESFTTVKNIDNTKHICSYIVTKNGFNLNDLKKYLNQYLPNYMIPTYFIKLKHLPINPNGKVDKNKLPDTIDKFINTRIIKNARTEKEALLLSIFKKILNIDDIGISDNFFDIGGDSLTAMKLQVEAVSNNLNISYSDIFKYPTVEELIKSLDNNNQNIISDKKVNYLSYDSLLTNNHLSNDIECIKSNVGNVLLTGFTGFLGAHILDSFIKQENGKIYCLIRSKNNMSARERLFNVLHFYFENKYDNLVDNRIILIEGDITFDKFGLSSSDYQTLGKNITTVIHSAALVKHYGQYKDFEEINVKGTKRIVQFAKDFTSKLLHVSTISVSGNNLAEGANVDNHFTEEKQFDETNFYIGQNLENLYAKSKFEAEKIVLDAIHDGLNACILRMGNLTSRYSEGKFQQNHFENAFVNRLKSFLQIGVFPKSLLHLYCEFTPIDYCGDAIISIAKHFNKKYTVFHLLNEKQVYLDRLFDMLNELGIKINLVSDNDFAITIQNILNSDSKRHNIEGIINDLTVDKKLSYKSDVNIKSDFTKEFLYKCGFEWPYIDINYMKNYFKYLIDIGYFSL